jgi:hypothetical protein
MGTVLTGFLTYGDHPSRCQSKIVGVPTPDANLHFSGARIFTNRDMSASPVFAVISV